MCDIGDTAVGSCDNHQTYIISLYRKIYLIYLVKLYFLYCIIIISCVIRRDFFFNFRRILGYIIYARHLLNGYINIDISYTERRQHTIIRKSISTINIYYI